LVEVGNSETIAKKYNQLFIDREETEEVTEGKKKRKRWGDQQVAVKVCRTDKPSYKADADETVAVSAVIQAREAIHHNVAVGFLVKNSAGTSILGINTYSQQQKIGEMQKDETVTVTWQVPNVFGDGKYYIDIAAISSDGSTTHDWREEVATFRVYRQQYSPYAITPTMPVTITRE
jgi:hypothetical protein